MSGPLSKARVIEMAGLARTLSATLVAILLFTAPVAFAQQRAASGLSALRDPTKLVAMGKQLEERGDLVQAMTFYDHALTVDPRNPAALAAAGENSLRRNDGQLAFDFYSKLAASDPKSATAQLGLGASLVMRQQPLQGLAALRRAAELGAPVAKVAAQRGLAYDLSGDSRSAQIAYAEALAFEPNNIETAQRMAVSLAISGSRAASLQLMQRFGANDTNSLELRRTLALIYAVTGDLATANEIAASILSAEDARVLAGFFAQLSGLSRHDKLMAAHFGRLPGSKTPPAPTPASAKRAAVQPAQTPALAAPASGPSAPPKPVAVPPQPLPVAKPLPLAQLRASPRVWVQLSSNRDRAMLAPGWARIRWLGRGLVDGQVPHVQRAGGTNRLLIGPFANIAQARSAVARLKARRISALPITTPAGADLAPL